MQEELSKVGCELSEVKEALSENKQLIVQMSRQLNDLELKIHSFERNSKLKKASVLFVLPAVAVVFLIKK